MKYSTNKSWNYSGKSYRKTKR